MGILQLFTLLGASAKIKAMYKIIGFCFLCVHLYKDYNLQERFNCTP